jgi:CheY-like chemotaxis protein
MNGSHRNALGASRLVRSVMSWLQRWAGFGTTRQTTGSFVPAVDAFSMNGGLGVLVVDDSPSNLMLATDALEQCGVVASVASNGFKAVELACERRFDIILMDLHMPVMDGLKATSRIRQFEDRYSRRRTPVVAFSTSAVSSDLLAASGVDDRLSKPCNTTELQACLLRWCDGFQPVDVAVTRPYFQTH